MPNDPKKPNPLDNLPPEVLDRAARMFANWLKEDAHKKELVAGVSSESDHAIASADPVDANQHQHERQSKMQEQE